MGDGCERILIDWHEAFEVGAGIAGGKGWNLGRLERYGFNIPKGGVLSSRVYQDFIKDNGLAKAAENIIQSITIDNIGDLESEEKLFLIREKIKAGCFSPQIQEELISRLTTIGILEKPLAIRSSATAEDAEGISFAGIHESFLNIQGKDNILSAIKGCYASLWTPRAVAYRKKMGVKDSELFMAIVIMEMVEAKAAGISFTCDPRTGREDLINISANFGLGESVVSGAVDPDEYRLNFKLEITQKSIGRKEGKTIALITGGTEFVGSAETAGSQVLTDENIRKLGLLSQRVFEALGCGEQHQDIEWVFNGKDFALVQARPVTALPRYTLEGIKNQPDIWSNANFRDAIPMVQSTLNWSFLKQGINAILDIPPKAMGYQVPPGMQYVRLYQGRAYLNLSIIQWLYYDAMGIAPREFNDALGGHQPEIEINEKKPFTGIKGCKRVAYILKTMFIYRKIRKNAERTFDYINAFTGALLKENLVSLDDHDLLDKIIQISNVVEEFLPVFSFSTTSMLRHLVKALDKYFPGKGNAMANALMAGGGNITSAQHGYDLVRMAEIVREDAAARRFFTSENFKPLSWDKELPEDSPFKHSFRNFLDTYGHRGVYEADLINPRWREDPTYILGIIRGSIDTADLSKIQERQKQKTEETWREIKKKIPFYRWPSIKSLLKMALKGAEFRELGKSQLIRISEPERLVFQELGRRLADRGILSDPVDIYHCAWSEILAILKKDWDGRGLDILVTERKVRRKELEALSPPDIITNEIPCYKESTTHNSGNMLTGVGVATGRAAGAAKLVYHPYEGNKLQTGDVLVAPSTDPGWTPLFLKAAAIVMETGGYSSHGSIVAREYGVPAVVNIPGIMKIIKDNQQITVDGDEGNIYVNFK